MLFLGIIILSIVGLGILYSASNQNLTLLGRQVANFGLAFLIMLILAQVPIYRYQFLVPWVFGLTLLMLLIVMNVGIISRGAQRWINLGWFRFQPSEIMKLAMSMMLAWYLRNKVFPLHLKDLFFSCLIIIVPVLVIAKQPDLGTALLVAATGCFVLLLAGITWKIIIGVSILVVAAVPIIWRFMHSYQKMRLLAFWSPEGDPFGSGYNIIQSKIAIGSGGWFGKGWLHGSQAHLQFLPERSTDFIFAVCGEEFGFIGCILLIGLFIYVIGRSVYISANAQDTSTRLLTGSLTLSFFTSFFVNIGMVLGVLPVVGVPLPLISYGGSSLIMFMASFGIIMSVQTHRRLIGN
ncbi:MAG: rod shape-determining protein RodA [Coxiellaceae bacterium]|jgi:rod shape determining protein RodA|nr:rod shape-determining protein RodA [Coxiellaceae bacterium]